MHSDHTAHSACRENRPVAHHNTRVTHGHGLHRAGCHAVPRPQRWHCGDGRRYADARGFCAQLRDGGGRQGADTGKKYIEGAAEGA